MTESINRKLPTWDDYYKNEKIEKMPWYNEKLDFDLEDELIARQLNNGIFLDLGTGPGTQAIELAKKGFVVVGSDIAETVIKRNKSMYENKYQNIRFVVDNILESDFKDNYFDYIFDRGCFHVFSEEDRPKYYNQIKRILKQKGILFLKCFSIDEPMKDGPYRFSHNDIHNIFSKNFQINKIKKTVYQGTLDPLPKALFSVMKLIKNKNNHNHNNNNRFRNVRCD
jgi:ubiquinone/menaquinone biosynthesis C-methylase UbiE